MVSLSPIALNVILVLGYLLFWMTLIMFKRPLKLIDEDIYKRSKWRFVTLSIIFWVLVPLISIYLIITKGTTEGAGIYNYVTLIGAFILAVLSHRVQKLYGSRMTFRWVFVIYILYFSINVYFAYNAGFTNYVEHMPHLFSHMIFGGVLLAIMSSIVHLEPHDLTKVFLGVAALLFPISPTLDGYVLAYLEPAAEAGSIAATQLISDFKFVSVAFVLFNSLLAFIAVRHAGKMEDIHIASLENMRALPQPKVHLGRLAAHIRKEEKMKRIRRKIRRQTSKNVLPAEDLEESKQE